MYRVAVLMSTFNGEKYLNEQIDSILFQEDVNLTLYIRDDGSTDKTIEIINEYLKKTSSVILTKGNNIGVGNSFMQLVYDVPNEYDFYAFSDQDDVWLPGKLKRAIEIISAYRKPILYSSNQTLVDKNLEYLGMRYSQKPDTGYLQILCKNKISGCTMVWNNTLNKLLQSKNRRPTSTLLQNRIHDVWVAMVAAIVGDIYFDMKSYIQYRQHENNVVGAKQKNICNDIATKFKKVLKSSERNGRSSLAKEICNKYGELITDQIILKHSALYKKRDLLKDVKDITICSGETTLGLATKILLGLY